MTTRCHLPPWAALTPLLLACPAVSGAVYRCETAEGHPHFAQFPCGSGRAVPLEPLHTVTIPPISEAEQRTLEALEARQRQERQARTRRHRQAAQAAVARQRDRRERCEAANSALESLERQRRKGYTLTEARALERREAELEREARQSC